MKRFFLLIFLLIPLVAPRLSFSAEILNNSEVLIGIEREYSENLYIGAVKTLVEGDILEDLVVAGGEVKITGNISGDTFLLGGRIDFSGQVSGDLRIIGGDVLISGQIAGDVLVLGGEVKILSTAVIEKEILVIGGKVALENNTPAELKVIAGKVSINGELSGATEVTTQNLHFGKDSKIFGQFSYYAPQRFSQEEGATFLSETMFNEINTIRESSFLKRVLLKFVSFWYLLRFLTNLILAFLLIYMFKVFSQEVADLMERSFWKSIGVGLLALFLSPIIVIVALISLVALPIGFLFGLFMIFVMIIAPVLSGIFIGNFLKRRFKKDNALAVDFKGSAVGVIILTGLQFVPWIGGWVILLLFIASVGAILRQIRISVIE
ncbi:MAG TPA: hypothetical protein P5328_01465 [Candidatus Paceibacterota bacterium]|nr:hypothetical protein [Candidatus Paceibacterota bacterium]HRZ34695.1 hypothetical protein [Candidatus Paceibacterota bacterium]